MPIGLAIVADDFTGGLMVANFIEALGIPVPLLTDPALLPDLGDQEVVVVATRLRFAPAAEAVASLDPILRALDAVGTRQLFYKYCSTFDSTDEGNIGPCADALIRHRGRGPILFGPAFPDLRTFVHEGYMFYRDRLISESSKRLDPITPMNDPDLVRVLQRQTTTRVGLLPHRILHQGPGAAAAWLDAEGNRGIRFFITDAVDNDDVRCSATVALHAPLVTGGDSLAIELARQHRAARGARAPDSPPDAPVPAGRSAAVLAGSCGAATLDQLSAFEERHPVLRIDPLATPDIDGAVTEALAWADGRLDAGPVGFTTAMGPEGVQAVQAVLGVMGAARRAEALLGGIAAGLFARGVRRFIVSGGETSRGRRHRARHPPHPRAAGRRSRQRALRGIRPRADRPAAEARQDRRAGPIPARA